MSRRNSSLARDSPERAHFNALLSPQDHNSDRTEAAHLSTSSSNRTLSIASYYYSSPLGEVSPSRGEGRITSQPFSSTGQRSRPLAHLMDADEGTSQVEDAFRVEEGEDERPFADWAQGLSFDQNDGRKSSEARLSSLKDPFTLSAPATPQNTAKATIRPIGKAHERDMSLSSEGDVGAIPYGQLARDAAISDASLRLGLVQIDVLPGDSASFLANSSQASLPIGTDAPRNADSDVALLTQHKAAPGLSRAGTSIMVQSPEEDERNSSRAEYGNYFNSHRRPAQGELPSDLEDATSQPVEYQAGRSSADMYSKLGIGNEGGVGLGKAREGLSRVGKSIRRMSRRVVNVDGTERPRLEGRIRLPDNDDDDSSSSDGGEMIAVQQVELEPAVAGLRGKSLGVLGPNNRLRQTLASLMAQWWIEPLILAMILFNVVLLVIQSSRSVFKQPIKPGYFDYWEDYALLSVFVVYTLEIVARIIVSGLIINPPAVYEAPQEQTSVDSPAETPMTQHMRNHPKRSNTIDTFAEIGGTMKQRAVELVRPQHHLGHAHGGAPPLSPNRVHAPRTVTSDFLGVRDDKETPTPLPTQSRSTTMSSSAKPLRYGSSSTPTIWEDKTSTFLRKTRLAPFAEAIMKQRAQAVDYAYLRHSWNRVDTIAVVAFWITFFLALSQKELEQELHLRVFRALSVLRCARLLTATRGTSVILRSLKTAGPLLVNVAFFLVFTMLLFSVIGVQSFEGNYLRSCVFVGDLQNNPASNLAGQNVTLSQVCGGHFDALTGERQPAQSASGRPLLIGIKGFLCPRGQVCVEASANPENNTESFDNIFTSLLQVVIIISSNGWSTIMYDMMDADYYASCLYFIIGLMIMNFWMANLFVAVITNTFATISAETKQSAFAAERIEPAPKAAVEESAAAQRRKRVANVFKRFWGYTKYFWLALIVADLGVQASQASYHRSAANARLNTAELYLTIAFDVEILMRFLSFLLDNDWRGFFGPKRNRFDLFLAVITTIIQIPPVMHSPAFPWLTVFQLARFYRVIAAVPRMEALLIRVFGSLSGLVNMILFLLLMVGLASLMAAQMFRGDLPQELEGEAIEINFKHMWNSFLGMYQIFSSENWTTPLYNVLTVEGQFQQAVIGGIFLCLWFLFANFIVLQMFIAVIAENFGVAESQKRSQQLERYLRNLEKPQTALIVRILHHLSPYRWLRERNAAKMGERVGDSADDETQLGANRALDTIGEKAKSRTSRFAPITPSQAEKILKAVRKFLQLDRQVEQMPLDTLRARQIRQSFSGASMLSDRRQMSTYDTTFLGAGLASTSQLSPGTPQNEETARLFARDRQLRRMRSDLGLIKEEGPNQTEVDEMHANRLRNDPRIAQAQLINTHPSYEKSLWLFSNTNRFRRTCQSFVPCSYGERLFGRRTSRTRLRVYQFAIFAAVAASVIIAGVATPNYRRDWYTKHGFRRDSWFSMTEVMLSLIFIAEFFIKVVADGFAFTPNAYLLSPWNALDLFVLLTLVVNVSTELAVIGGVSRFTRALKAFRALRLINLSDFMRRTFSGLVAVSGRFIDASILAILYIVPFAIWGQNLFSGLLYSCTDGSEGILTKRDCINEYSASPSQWSFLAPRAWQNPTEGSVYSFDDFRSSLLILFEIVSLEGWTNVMSTAMSVVGYNQQLQTDNRQINALFFVIYNLIGAIFVLTLFVAVIIESFQSFSGAAYFTTAQRQWIDLKRLIRRQRPSKRPKVRPTGQWRMWCYDRAVHKHGWWSRAMTLLYVVSLITLATQQYKDSDAREKVRDIIYITLAAIFAIDLLVRLYGLGWRPFRQDMWNLFDLIVVTGTLVTSIPLLSPNPSNRANMQVQKFFLVAVALKLVQKNNSLNQLLKTAVTSLPSIASLFLVWLTFFLVWGIMLVEVFGLTAWGTNETWNKNFTSLLRALVFLSLMSTGEGWNSYMHDFTLSAPYCTTSNNYLNTDCGSEGWAYFLFVGWNVISMYIFLNMFTATVVENFSYVFQLGGKPTLSREQVRNFKKAWAEMDKGRTGYMPKEKFIPFFNRLEGTLQVRVYPVEASIKVLKEKALVVKSGGGGGRMSFDHSSRGSRSPTRGITSVLRLKSPIGGGGGGSSSSISKDGVDESQDHSQFVWPPSPNEIVVDGIDINKLNRQLSKIDHVEIRRRKHRFERLYNEACLMSERPQDTAKGGISFTDMLMLLAHYKLIDDAQALSVEELMERRELMQHVEDRIETQRVRSILRRIWLRRRFLAMLDARDDDVGEGRSSGKEKQRAPSSSPMAHSTLSPTRTANAKSSSSSRGRPALRLDLGNLSSLSGTLPEVQESEEPAYSPMQKTRILREADAFSAHPGIQVTTADESMDREENRDSFRAGGKSTSPSTPSIPPLHSIRSLNELSPSTSLQDLERRASPVIQEIDASAWGTLARRLSSEDVLPATAASPTRKASSEREIGRQSSPMSSLASLRSRIAGKSTTDHEQEEGEESALTRRSANSAAGSQPEMTQSDQSSTASIGRRGSTHQQRDDWI